MSGEAGALPLLSTALLDLWRERNGSPLTLDAYRRIGGVRGVVERHAESAYRSLSVEEQRSARRILLRLVSGGVGETLTRRRVSRADLDVADERAARVLDVLIERRLVVASEGTVELVHEALLEQWPRLGGGSRRTTRGAACTDDCRRRPRRGRRAGETRASSIVAHASQLRSSGRKRSKSGRS